MMRHPMRGFLMTVALAGLFAGTAFATVGSGLSGTFLSRGTLTESVHFNTGDIKFQTKEPVDFVTQTITFGANSTSGWHAHPGVVMVSVTSGELTRYASDCSYETVSAGEAFVESGDHAGLVNSVSGAVVYVTYVVPEGTTNAQLRIDKPNPGCPGIN
jgi:quercetin dioxygenase-like cupin family protein